MSKVKKTIKFRDADSGHYITQKEAEKNPKTSVKETDKVKRKTIKKKK